MNSKLCLKKILLLFFILSPIQSFIFQTVAEEDTKNLELESVKSIVRETGNSIIDLMKTNLSKAEKEEKLMEILNDYFALEKIVAFVIGKNLGKFTKEQKKVFFKLFKNNLVKTYSSNLTYSNESLIIKKARKNTINNNVTFTVISEISRPTSSTNLKIDWIIILTDKGEKKIRDILINKVSLSLAKRKEYYKLIKQAGDIDTFLKNLDGNKVLNKKELLNN